MGVRLNGLTFFYATQGHPSAVPLIFLHGFPFNHTMWQPQFDFLKKDCRVIAYDQRGHGQSETGNGPFTLEFLVDDFFALLDVLTIPKAIVCGLSMGGYVALRAIERDPSRFQALVLCDTRSEADSNEAKIKRASQIKTIQKDGVSVFAEEFLKGLFAPESFRARPEVIDNVRQMIRKNSPLGICGTLLALASRTDTTPSLAAIQVPTLILVGEKDGMTPPSAAGAMQQQIRGSKMHMIPGAGHMSNLENPADFNRHVSEFVLSLR
ncbi:MAG: alpha/beta fold hydrolase [Elusimicrobiota bacterium]|jgi:3-oxoadipate enol-lactonase